MHDLLNLEFESSPVRIILQDGEPWFVATDVAAILGYRNAPDMVRNLDDDEAATHNMRSSGQNREVSIISESGLYNAIFKSRRAEAKAFRRWVTGTVLPQIRRSGSYNVHPHALVGPLAALPDVLGTRQAVQLRDVAAALSFASDGDSLQFLAAVMRSQGWRKAWVRADAVEPVARLPRLFKGDGA